LAKPISREKRRELFFSARILEYIPRWKNQAFELHLPAQEKPLALFWFPRLMEYILNNPDTWQRPKSEWNSTLFG